MAHQRPYTKPTLTIALAALLFLLPACATSRPADAPAATSTARAMPSTAAIRQPPHPGQTPPPPPPGGPYTATIAFTFDDGYISDYNLAYPILKKFGIRGTSYIIGRLADGNTPHALTWDDIKAMHGYGWDFGCHTYNHVDMTTLTPDEIKASLEKENATFEAHGLPAPDIMAYPSGKFDPHVIDVVKLYRKQARLAYYESKFVDLKHVNPYEVDSISADMQEPPRLKSREELVDKACREHAVIVFRTHCMYFEHKSDNGKWDVQTDSRLFAQLVQYCVDKGCRFITMTQLMSMYSGGGN